MKKLVEDLPSIDIKDIKEILDKSREKCKIELVISDKYLQEIDVTATAGNFGGLVYWFICPGCKKRKKKLYLSWNVFLCRDCQSLAYRTQNLRDFRKTKYIRKKNKEDIFHRRTEKRIDLLKELKELNKLINRI
jgi:hypothetical protein